MGNERLEEDAVLKNVGLRIAELREQRGLTQADLAGEIGVEPRNAQRYEAGVNLTLATLVRIANALGVAPEMFFRRARRPKRSPGRPPARRRRA